MHICEVRVGYTYLAEKSGVTSRRQVLNWVHNYKKCGDKGLMRSRKQKKYSFEYKLHAVELYLSSELSYQKLALFEEIRNVEQTGDRSTEVATFDASAEHVKQLEHELLKVRIENAYLKELRRLRLEEETLLKKQRESSTASEEKFRLKDILAVVGLPKATYMYWQKRFDRENPDKELGDKILEIHEKVTSFTRKSRKYSSYKSRVGTNRAEQASQLQKLKKSKQKYLDMFDNDIITMSELKAKTSEFNKLIFDVEERLKIVKLNISKSDMLKANLNETFKDIESLLKEENITNNLLSRVIEKITVDENGKVDVYLRLLSDVGLENAGQLLNSHT